MNSNNNSDDSNINRNKNSDNINGYIIRYKIIIIIEIFQTSKTPDIYILLLASGKDHIEMHAVEEGCCVLMKSVVLEQEGMCKSFENLERNYAGSGHRLKGRKVAFRSPLSISVLIYVNAKIVLIRSLHNNIISWIYKIRLHKTKNL